MKHMGAGLLALTSGIAIGQASAQSLPPVNLGLTSFADGIPPAGPGFYYQQYFQFYSADSFKDSNGDDLAVPDQPSIDVWASLNQLIYQSDQKLLFDGKWGIDLIVPIVGTDLDPGSLPIRDNGAGLGDILVGPFLQWDPIIRDGRPIFAHRIELQTIFPSGKYDGDRQINPGSHVWSFNPYWAATVFPTPRTEASVRIHYLWNSENDDVAGVDNVQPGQAVHLNFAGSYELLPKQLRIGVNGYFLKQITDAQLNGDDVNDSKEQVLGIGPGVLYSFSQNDHIFVNFYWEMLTENRPEGWRAVLRWTHHF
jgi:hypothetical protein